MAITEFFRQAVETRDVRGIRIMMKDSLLVDPTFIEFQGMEALAKNVDGLYDAHDGREFNLDKSMWNDDYMNKLMVQVVGNFSKERINHLKDVVKHLRPVASRPQASASSANNKHSQTTGKSHTKNPQPTYNQQKQKDEREGRIVIKRSAKIAMGAAAGGVAGGAVAYFAGISTVLGVTIGTTIGAVTIGVVVAIATKGGKSHE